MPQAQIRQILAAAADASAEENDSIDTDEIYNDLLEEIGL